MKMIRIIYITLAILLATNLSSCKKDDVEIVNQDLSYQLDPDYIFVDIPEEFKFNPNNIAYLAGRNELGISFRFDEETDKIILSETQIPITIRLKKPLSETVIIVFTEDESLIDNYMGEKDGYVSFPEGVLSNTTFTIPKGETEVEGVIKFENAELLIGAPKYLVGLRMTLKSELENISISSDKYAIYIKASESSLKNEENVSYATALPSTMYYEIDRGELSGHSDYASDHVFKLFNGGIWTDNWWIPTGRPEDLIVTLPKGKVGAIRMYFNNYWSEKTVKSVKIAVSADGIKFFEQGKVTNPTASITTFYILFDNPNEITHIRFYEFVAHTSEAADISQIKVYTVD